MQGKTPPEDVADVPATAARHRGTCVGYLHSPVAHLEDLCIHDRNLWGLQVLVVGKISAGPVFPADEAAAQEGKD